MQIMTLILKIKLGNEHFRIQHVSNIGHGGMSTVFYMMEQFDSMGGMSPLYDLMEIFNWTPINRVTERSEVAPQGATERSEGAPI